MCPQCGRKYDDGEAFCPYDGARLRSPLSAPPAVSDPLVGTVLDRYRLERVLGRGGMGTVYAGRLEALDKPCAVKVLRPVMDGGQALGRFEREARTAGSLGNQHIVDIFDFGRADGLAFLVMELLEGHDLGDLLGRERLLSVHRAVPIIMQCCAALGAAHAAGIVHRDLKPENIFLVSRPGYREFVKIVDFGLAKYSDTEQEGDPGRKLTKTGMIFGTPQYMSPEQCTGKPTDHRSDIYSLGLMFYELLCGRVPFDGDTFMGVINQHLVDLPRPMRELNPHAEVPVALEAVIYRCLDKKARNRPQTMREFADEILAALRSSGMGELAERLQPMANNIDEPVSAMRLTKKKSSRHPPASLAPSAVPSDKGLAFAHTAPEQHAVDPEDATLLAVAPTGLLDPRGHPASEHPPAGQPAGAQAPTPQPHIPPRGTPLTPKGPFVPKTREVPTIDPLPPVAQARRRRATPTGERAPRLDLGSDQPTPWTEPAARPWGTYLAYGVGLLVLGGLLGYLLLIFLE